MTFCKKFFVFCLVLLRWQQLTPLSSRGFCVCVRCANNLHVFGCHPDSSLEYNQTRGSPLWGAISSGDVAIVQLSALTEQWMVAWLWAVWSRGVDIPKNHRVVSGDSGWHHWSWWQLNPCWNPTGCFRDCPLSCHSCKLEERWQDGSGEWHHSCWHCTVFGVFRLFDVFGVKGCRWSKKDRGD